MKKVFLVKIILLLLIWTLPAFGLEHKSASSSSDLQQRVLHLQQLMAKAKANSSNTKDTKAEAQKLADATASTAPANVSDMPPPAAAPAPAQTQNPDLPPPAATQTTASGATDAPPTADPSRSTLSVNQEELGEQAFGGVVGQLLPMSSDQIAKLREAFNETQLAAATPAGIPPKPTTTSLIVNLSPQSAPPVIRLGAGYISSLVFMDSTGQPWPIAAYSIGDPNAFNIQWDKKGNTLLVQSASFYKRSNLAVILKDLNTPVMLTLLAGQGAVDYRVDLRIPELGPNAMFVQNGLPDMANPELLEVLNGVPPHHSKRLKVTGGDAEAWIVRNKLYLRTTLDIISPAWQAIMTSIDGTHAYLLQPSPVILALQRGKEKTLTLNIEGLE